MYPFSFGLGDVGLTATPDHVKSSQQTEQMDMNTLNVEGVVKTDGDKKNRQ